MDEITRLKAMRDIVLQRGDFQLGAEIAHQLERHGATVDRPVIADEPAAKERAVSQKTPAKRNRK